MPSFVYKKKTIYFISKTLYFVCACESILLCIGSVVGMGFHILCWHYLKLIYVPLPAHLSTNSV